MNTEELLGRIGDVYHMPVPPAVSNMWVYYFMRSTLGAIHGEPRNNSELMRWPLHVIRYHMRFHGTPFPTDAMMLL